VTRAGSRDIAGAVRVKVNEQLEALKTGVEVVALEIPRSSVPGQTIDAFNQVTMAENERQKSIREAETARSEALNGAAGAAWRELVSHKDDVTGEQQVGLIDQYDAALAAGESDKAKALLDEINTLLETKAGGNAGERLRQAKSFYTQVVQAVQGDLGEYRAALVEYKRSPALFLNRMWQRTRARIMQNDGVTKHFTSSIFSEIRIEVAPDPEQRRIDELNKLRREQLEYDYMGPQHLRPVMPEEP
jgi:regulator of protease activity HflC (stomatin/prohibitin superfamily)